MQELLKNLPPTLREELLSQGTRQQFGAQSPLLREGQYVKVIPIVLTGLAAMAGAFFILDDPIFNGLAISLIFGILISTLLTLVVAADTRSPPVAAVVEAARRGGNVVAFPELAHQPNPTPAEPAVREEPREETVEPEAEPPAEAIELPEEALAAPSGQSPAGSSWI